MKLSSILNNFLLTVILLGYMVTVSHAAAPKLFFSDMQDGVATGFDGSSTRGAAVSLWGLNLGTVRGTSYVSVGGVNLTADTDYVEWAATTNPTTARGLERITFFLNSSMIKDGVAPNTSITVTTSEGTSNSLPFHVRSRGKIYFVSPTGNDSNSGVRTSAPWKTFGKVRQVIDAGDVAYFRSGLYVDPDVTLMEEHSILTLKLDPGVGNNFNNGQEWNSITLTSYPGEVAQVGDGTDTGNWFIVYRKAYSGVSTLSYWNFSKFKFVGSNNVFAWYYRPDGHEDKELRIIGNDITTNKDEIGQGIAINPYTNAHGLRIWGNYFHGVGKLNDDDPFGYKVQPIYFGGGHSSLLDIGWNEFSKNNGTSTQVFGHFYKDSMDLLLWHDNYSHDNGRSSLVIGGGDPSTEPPYCFNKEVRIYNNIFTRDQNEIRLTGLNRSGEGVPNEGNFYIYNNTIVNNNLAGDVVFWAINMGHMEIKNNIIVGSAATGGYYTSHMGNSDNITGSNNIITSVPGSLPSWESSTLINIDPQFIVGAPQSFLDFQLQESSPAIKAGTASPSLNIPYDFLNKNRNQPYDIGAFEYSNGTNQFKITILDATIN